MLAFPSLLRTISWVSHEDLEDDINENAFKEGYYMLMPKKVRSPGKKTEMVYRLSGSGYYLNKIKSFSDTKTEYARFYITMKLFEIVCKENNIDLSWTILDISDKEVLNFIKNDFGNTFIELNNVEDKVIDLIAKDPKYTYDKADGHRGTGYHKIWSEGFVKKFLEAGDK
jgi:hypothetical protein